MSENHKVIYLQPECLADFDEGRHWCEDDVWDDDCECGKDCRAVKYVLKEAND